MAPSNSRLLLVWGLPTIALFLSYFWYKKKRLGHQSDTRDNVKNQGKVLQFSVAECKGSKNYLESSGPQEIPQGSQSSYPVFSRSLSGIDTAPIDIIIPPEMRAVRSNPIIISDEDLDLEIEKIKSMKSSFAKSSRSMTTTPIKTRDETNRPNTPFKKVIDTSNQDRTITIVASRPSFEEDYTEAIAEIPKTIIVDCKKVVPEVTISLEDKAKEVVEEVVTESSSQEVLEASAESVTEIVTETDCAASAENSTDTENQPKQEEASVKKTPLKGPKSRRFSAKMKESAKKEAQTPEREMSTVEDRMAAVKISSSKRPNKRGRNKTKASDAERTTQKKNEHRDDSQRKSSDRDSANHSPAEHMLASPSLSNISDNGSCDSGKGGSDMATPPNYVISATDSYIRSDQLVAHEFEVPSELVGRLIGRRGAFVTQIKNKTNAEILVKTYPGPYTETKVCSVEGTTKEVDAALKMIRKKFPLENYPKLTLQAWQSSPIQLLPDKLYLKLVEGINNDTTICCVESPVHLFVQFPTHPSYPNLVILHNCMQMCYSTESPELPNPVPVGAICAARSNDDWYRAQILSTDGENSYIKFLDWGGYQEMSNKDLRKIRYDFTLLPFQAAECILANVQPKGGPETEWADEALEYIEEISRATLVYTQVADYTPEGTPVVLCFIHVGNQQIINLNRELVERGFGEWIEPSEAIPPPSETVAAVAAM